MILNSFNKYYNLDLSNKHYFKKYLYSIYILIINNYIIINILLLITNILTLFFLLLNYLYYKFANTLSNKLLIILKYFIINSGVIYIKLFQWILSKEDLLNINTKNIKKLKYIFSDIFENCYYHHSSYTNYIINNEFYNYLNNPYIVKNLVKNLNTKNIFSINNLHINYNPISSGSIAQIYEASYYDLDNSNNNIIKLCFKIVHPHIYLQCFWTNFFLSLIFKILRFFKSDNINIFDLPFDYNSLYNNFLNQCNMKNEYENILKFYYTFDDNNFIIIPKPLYANNSILLMEYVKGERLNDMDESIYIKNKIITLLQMFNNDCILFKNIIHCDLHESNWKLQKYNNFYKIIIYDFGYCQQLYKNLLLKNFMEAWMIEDIDNIVQLSFKIFVNINNNDINYIKSECIQYLTNIVGYSINILDIIKMIIKFSNKFNCDINNESLNIIISYMLLENNLKKYGVIKCYNIDNMDDKYYNIKEYSFNNIALCIEYNIFPDIKNFYNNFINKNDNKFKNKFKSKLKNKSNLIQLSNNNNNNNNNTIII